MNVSWQYARRRKYDIYGVPNPHRHRYELKEGVYVPVGVTREPKPGDVVSVEGVIGLYVEYNGDRKLILLDREEFEDSGTFATLQYPPRGQLRVINPTCPVFDFIELERLEEWDYVDGIIESYKIYQKRVGIQY